MTLSGFCWREPGPENKGILKGGMMTLKTWHLEEGISFLREIRQTKFKGYKDPLPQEGRNV